MAKMMPGNPFGGSKADGLKNMREAGAAKKPVKAPRPMKKAKPQQGLGIAGGQYGEE